MTTSIRHRGFKWTTSDESNPSLALLVDETNLALHVTNPTDAETDWNVSAYSHPTLVVHSNTTPATDYVSIWHDATYGYMNVASGTLALQVDGTSLVLLASTGLTVLDDALLAVGTGSTARLSWDTTDANSNQMLLQLPAAGSVDSPVLVIGQSIESVDMGAAASGADYSSVVDPRIAIFSSGAVTTGPVVEFRKARGTTAAPTVCTTGDDIGTIDFYGAVANGEYVRGASIQADIAGTIATTRGPGTLTFLTATDAAPSVLTAALTISAAQLVTAAAGVTVTTGNVTISSGDLSFAAAASDILVKAATAAALEISDATTKFYALDTRVTTVGATTHTFNISAYTLASAATAVATGWSFAAHTLNLTGNTQVTSAANTASIGARTIAGAAAITVDQANSLVVLAPIEGTNVTLTATAAIRISTTTGTPTNQYGLYIDTLTGGTTANRGIYLAGANGIQFAAADDIIFPAATAAALELSDGTTKYYAIDSRVAVKAVTTHTLSISAYTIASAADAVVTAFSVAAHTLNLTGNTQVTSAANTASLGARTIAGAEAITVDQANTLRIAAPVEGTNVTLTAASALRIADAGGTPTNQYGIYIEALTAGATADYAIWVAGASPVHLGTAGTAAGTLEIDGSTSGTATIITAASTTSYTLTLPAAANTNAGYLLTCAGADTLTSWAAPASLRELKDIHGEHAPEDALSKILGTKVYDFHYKDGKGTGDSKTNYVGVVADEAPWAMHYEGGVVNPVNALGYTLLGIQALERRLRELEARLN